MGLQGDAEGWRVGAAVGEGGGVGGVVVECIGVGVRSGVWGGGGDGGEGGGGEPSWGAGWRHIEGIFPVCSRDVDF